NVCILLELDGPMLGSVLGNVNHHKDRNVELPRSCPNSLADGLKLLHLLWVSLVISIYELRIVEHDQSTPVALDHMLGLGLEFVETHRFARIDPETVQHFGVSVRAFHHPRLIAVQ